MWGRSVAGSLPDNKVAHIRMTSSGIAAARLASFGKGEMQPVAGNESAEGRQQNRRVEVVIENERAPAVATRQALSMRGTVLKAEFDRGNAFSRSLLMFSSALITQMVQTAACNRHHTVDQQLCRWMLLSLDRLPTGQISAGPCGCGAPLLRMLRRGEEGSGPAAGVD
jgi:hypothetical protein